MLKARRSILISLLIVFSSIWITTLILSAQDRSRVLAQSTQRVERLAKAAAFHAERSVLGADILAKILALEYLDQGEAINLSAWKTRSIADTRDYPQAGIINSKGFLIAGTSIPFVKLDLNDRPHFIFHKNGSSDPLFVGRTVVGRASGKLSIQVTRRIDKPGKGFVGVAVVSFSPQYFAELYKDIVSPGRAMYLVGEDGYTRTEYSGAELKTDRDVRSTRWFQEIEKQAGKDSGLITVSNENRDSEYYAYQRVPGLPLMVVISASKDEMFSDYLAANRTRYMAAILMSLGLCILFIVIEMASRKARKYESDLQLKSKNLTSALEVKEVFIRNISHELRTPLAGIKAGADFIKNFSDEEDMRETAESIRSASDHLKNIVDNLLMLSAVGPTSTLAKKEHVNVLDVVEEVIAMNQAEASRKGLALSLKHSDIDPPFVATSRTALIQVFQNLVNNAIKFTDRGGVAFDVQLDGKVVKIVIEDTGAGISPEDIPKLFKQFTQLEEFGSRPLSGTGLGLYLSAQLVESFGGQMGVESVVGIGSKFSVTLPFIDVENKG